MYDLIIIGLGPAGISACVYSKRSNLNVLVIEKDTPGGKLNSLDVVDNYLGYSNITGTDLAMNFYKQFKSLDIPLKKEDVLDIEDYYEYKQIITDKNTYKTKAIIVATGRGILKLGLPNENIKGVSYCALCDANLYKNKDVCLYGNGQKNLEDALYLSNICKKVYLICNENSLIGKDDTVKIINNSKNIDVILNNRIININGKGVIESVGLLDKVIDISGLFINNGYGPMSYFCKELGIVNEKWYILVDDKYETKVKGIFACGDVIDKNVYQIITAASEGACAAINAYKYIKNN